MALASSLLATLPVALLAAVAAVASVLKGLWFAGRDSKRGDGEGAKARGQAALGRLGGSLSSASGLSLGLVFPLTSSGRAWSPPP